VFRGTRFPRNKGPALADIATTMGRHCLLTAVVFLLATGCADRASQASPQDRLAALRACSTAVRTSALRTHPTGALRQLERCMARRALPGHATFDAGAKAIRFAYDPPTLRF
jgi:hypothetical protein